MSQMERAARISASKNFIAVTLDEFRANWKYNFGDDKMQSFLSKTPIFNQWDDHEVSCPCFEYPVYTSTF